MKKQVKFNDQQDRHDCISWQENDHIVFQCPTCGFSRKLHLKTGELVNINGGDPNVLHSGTHEPVLEDLKVLSSN